MQSDAVPAPEETVETTDERCPHILIGSIYGDQQCYLKAGHEGPHEDDYSRWPNDPPAPEPAGEAEEPGDYQRDPEKFRGSFGPVVSPSPGTPGLKMAERRLLSAWHGYALPDDASLDAIHEFADEVRAPLKARIAELEHDLREWRGRFDELRVQAKQYRADLEAELEDAERKLEGMQEARDGVIESAQVLLDMRERGSVGLEKFHMPWLQLEEAIERALTPPASID